jgi:phosphoribosylformylglycinamidine synthase
MTYYHKIRLFVEKKEAFQVEAQALKNELNHNLHLNIQNLRLINVYDIFEIESELLDKAKTTIFSEPVTDTIYEEIDLHGLTHFAIEINDHLYLSAAKL